MTPASDKVSHTLLCCGVFMLWYTIALLVNLLPHIDTLKSQGMLMPALCMLEFAALVPVYQWYTRRFTDIPLGELRARQLLLFCALLLATMASQSLYLLPESWTAGQTGYTSLSRVGFCLAVVLLAPIFEEILFRGFILQGFLLWAPHQRLGCAIMTSLIFALLHSQYVHLQTVISLVVLSLLLCAARFVSGGLRLPMVLHMLNNFLGVAPLFWQSLSRQSFCGLVQFITAWPSL
ncbi:CPBP family intramembrane glutamic endopeptidase [Erwinia pyrifoliae]|uniref:CPBP family intramembrane glutamic endopeptidase n=1 Tax=Erwinia pyrifoliae TaxID=79967 RepID=UPI00223B3B68|nr:CPBP family intramembrane glutamic endopeptidase [Erwinia pyrifoliae]MCT2388112.1 CPBP family intramembrane metalloprotease [Erwinia pyrifoliae]MCU8586282.1 CPBP family intramembrane metalloprotease [Erwinia pyrifoliae]